jgi:hypothetical protein
MVILQVPTSGDGCPQRLESCPKCLKGFQEGLEVHGRRKNGVQKKKMWRSSIRRQQTPLIVLFSHSVKDRDVKNDAFTRDSRNLRYRFCLNFRWSSGIWSRSPWSKNSEPSSSGSREIGCNVKNTFFSFSREGNELERRNFFRRYAYSWGTYQKNFVY